MKTGNTRLGFGLGAASQVLLMLVACGGNTEVASESTRVQAVVIEGGFQCPDSLIPAFRDGDIGICTEGNLEVVEVPVEVCKAAGLDDCSGLEPVAPLAPNSTGSGGTGASSGSGGMSTGSVPFEQAPECPFQSASEVDPLDPYPYCQLRGRTESMCWERNPDTGSMWTNYRVEDDQALAVGVDTGNAVADDWYNTCACLPRCDVQACPAPNSGTAQPECLQFSEGPAGLHCGLTCNSGESCPNGMYCLPHPELPSRICAWYSWGARCDDSLFE